MKKKHLPVILFSSGIVLVIFLTTLSGYSLYTQFKKDAFTVGYRDSIARITADIFRQDLVFSNVRVKAPKDEQQSPHFEGALLNKGERSLTSLLIELVFSDTDGRVLHKEWIRPLLRNNFDGMLFSSDNSLEGGAISPGESINFKHVLRNCPDYLITKASAKWGFARKKVSSDVKFTYSIVSLKIL